MIPITVEYGITAVWACPICKATFRQGADSKNPLSPTDEQHPAYYIDRESKRYRWHKEKRQWVLLPNAKFKDFKEDVEPLEKNKSISIRKMQKSIRSKLDLDLPQFT